MNSVDKIVKKGIINFFGIFPSRLHVLNHIVLGIGTGYEWEKLDDNLFHLVGHSRPYTPVERIEHNKTQYSMTKSGDSFHNHIADWISDNIDTYCLKSFYAESLNLNPTKIDSNISRELSPFATMPSDLSLIHPDWIDAMIEVVDAQLELYKRMDSRIDLNFKNKESRMLISHKYNAYSTAFCIIANNKEKFDSFNKQNDLDLEAFHDELCGGGIQTRYEQFSLKDKISFEVFEKFENEIISNYRTLRYSTTEYAQLYLDTEAKYFTNGEPNELFTIDARNLIENFSFYKDRFHINSLVSEISKKLKIRNKDFILQIEIFVNDNIYDGIACS
jgi:hypothetical protein